MSDAKIEKLGNSEQSDKVISYLQFQLEEIEKPNLR